MTVIATEIERFNRLSTTWWNSTGPMRPLHVVNALRLGSIAESIERHFGLARGAPLKRLRILDLGCGGGLLSEPLARLGASVLGIDASAGNVEELLLAIVAAKYLLRVLPRGTHQWQRFVRPAELAAAVAWAGLAQTDLRGMRYLGLPLRPRTTHWRQSYTGPHRRRAAGCPRTHPQRSRRRRQRPVAVHQHGFVTFVDVLAVNEVPAW